MSIEDISSRTTRFFEEVLTNKPEDLQRSIAGRSVSIALDPSWAESPNGQLCLFSLMNILIRLDKFCPYLYLDLPMVDTVKALRILGKGPLKERLADFFSDFPAFEKVVFRKSHSDLSIRIQPHYTGKEFLIWNNGWAMYWNTPILSKAIKANPIGSLYAGVFAGNEIFKKLIEEWPLRPGLRLIPAPPLIFNTYNYSQSDEVNPEFPERVNLDEAYIIGVGGIGSAMVLALSCCAVPQGQIFLIDPDSLDITNLNRYLIGTIRDIGSPKVEIAKRFLEGTLRVNIIKNSYAAYTKGMSVKTLPLVVISVDSDAIRREVQSDLPRVILNAGTGDVVWRVTRHDYINRACLSCISRADHEGDPIVLSLAQKLALPISVVQQYWDSAEPLPRTLLNQSTKLSPDQIEICVDKRLRDLREQICANPHLFSSSEEAVSLPSLSAMPGILLAGELIKEVSDQNERVYLNSRKNHFLASILSYPQEKQLSAMEKVPGCGCTEEIYQSFFNEKWKSAAG